MKCPNCNTDNPDNTKFCGNCATVLSPSNDTQETRTKTLNAPFSDLATGSILAGRYEIIEEVGSGGMGKVFKAYDKEVKEKVALKLINPEIALNKNVIDRFRKELKMARKIAHRNVCRMYDLEKDEDRHFITMEYVPGEDMKKTIKRMGALTVEKAVSIGKQICEGLSEAHRLGVVHRDLKPHNIMIDREGNTRIMDFGIAFSQKEEITESGIMFGTPQYISPEQAEGKKVDQRSDIYSLGIILYEMVTGQVPFDGDTPISIALKQKSETPRDTRQFNAQVPDALNKLILKCLEKDPDKRYQGVEEVCSALTEIQVEREPAETAFHAKKRTRFSPGLRYLLLAVLIVTGGYFIYDRFARPGAKEHGIAKEIKWKNTILVLPFKDLNPQQGQETFYVGMTNGIIMGLQKFRELGVIDQMTAMIYKDSYKSPHEIGRDLGVDFVLGGTLYVEKDGIRVSTQLISVEDGAINWSFNEKRERKSVLELQDYITKSIANVLGVQLVDLRFDSIKTKASKSLEANDHYQGGQYYENRYYETRDTADFEFSVANYLKAVEYDPGFALPYWRLGLIFEQRLIDDSKGEHMERMSRYFHKAYQIAPDLAEANDGLGIYHFTEGDNDKAFQYFKKAYGIDPNNADINFHIGSFYRSIGMYKQAAHYYDRALELNPMSPMFDIWHYLRAECYAYSGRFDEAENFLIQSLNVKPDTRLHLRYAMMLIMLNNHKAAGDQLKKAEEQGHELMATKRCKAWLYAAKGERKRALELIQDQKDSYRYPITSIYSILGMKDKAINNIRRGIEIGFLDIKMYLYSYPILLNNPCYDNLRDDPRFKEIVKKQKEIYEENMNKYGIL